MKNIVVVGAGNVGLFAARALSNEKEMRLCAFLRRKKEPVPGFEDIPVVTDVSELSEKPDGAIVCVPSRNVEKTVLKFLETGIATVDAFDIHSEISVLKDRFEHAAKEMSTAAITGAGWDPGMDSAIRILMLAASPEGKTETNFGPGISMGHSAAAKAIPGVSDAVSVTIPLGEGKHRREVYASLEAGADEELIREKLLADKYFSGDETEIYFEDDVSELKNYEHAVLIERDGVSAGEKLQRFEFRACLNNPAVTAQILVSAMRAALRMPAGAYFLPEIPPVLLAENFVGSI